MMELGAESPDKSLSAGSPSKRWEDKVVPNSSGRERERGLCLAFSPTLQLESGATASDAQG